MSKYCIGNKSILYVTPINKTDISDIPRDIIRICKDLGNKYKDENKTNKMEETKMNKYELELEKELLSGRVVKLINGEYGLITDTPNFGKLVGFYRGVEHIMQLLDENVIDAVYDITDIDQILGLGIHEDNLELVYQVVPTITTLDQLKELLEDNEIYVNIDLKG